MKESTLRRLYTHAGVRRRALSHCTASQPKHYMSYRREQENSALSSDGEGRFIIP